MLIYNVECVAGGGEYVWFNSINLVFVELFELLRANVCIQLTIIYRFRFLHSVTDCFLFLYRE